jgi:hypothetical protein
MKIKYTLTSSIYILLINCCISQIGIGTIVINSSTVLNFGTDNKVIILPWVASQASVLSPNGGTLIFDTNDKKVKYYNDNSNTWIDLSINSGAVNTSIQDSYTENSNKKFVIGNQNTTKSGVLILDTPNKALQLPKVNDVVNTILNPEAGSIVYDSLRKKIAVYNGINWTFWGQ